MVSPSRPKVVVIDDEKGPRESLRMILKEVSEVYTAELPEEGLALVAQQDPDLVFLDIRMPGMDGTEVLRRIKQRTPDTEVAMITAYAAVESAQEAVRQGALDYLTKPFGVDEVLKVLERAQQRVAERRQRRVYLEQVQRAGHGLAEQLRELQRRSELADISVLREGLSHAQSMIADQREGMARLSAIGEIAAEVAHEVDDSLSQVLGRIEALVLDLRGSQQVEASQVEHALQGIVQATQEGAHALARISLLSPDPYEYRQPVDLARLLREALDLTAGQAPADGPDRVVWDLPPLPSVTGNAANLRVALMQALQQMRVGASGGALHLTARAEGEWALLELRLAGAKRLPATDEAALPLAQRLGVARKELARHGGSLSSREDLEGVTVTARLPLLAGPASGQPLTPAPDVLVVDSDEKLLALAQDCLDAAGLQVQTLTSGLAAAGRFEQYARQDRPAPRVLITELRLPDLPGTELAQRVKQLFPATRVVLLSSHLHEYAGLESSPYLDAVLSKPFSFSDLLREAQSA